MLYDKYLKILTRLEKIKIGLAEFFMKIAQSAISENSRLLALVGI